MRDGERRLSTPGPYYLVGSNVWVDQNGWLHLKITNVNGQWFCAEAVSTQTFSYGTYTFSTVSRIDNFDPNVVLGIFVYKDGSHESDIEYTKWSVKPNSNGWFTVQPPPVYDGVTFHGFNFQMCGDYATSYIKWTPNSVYFEADGGHYSRNSTQRQHHQQFHKLQTGRPDRCTRDINLWLFRGARHLTDSQQKS